MSSEAHCGSNEPRPGSHYGNFFPETTHMVDELMDRYGYARPEEAGDEAAAAPPAGYYKQACPPRYSNYNQRSHDELLGDVNVLHDFTRKLLHEKDLIYKRLGKAQRQLGFEVIWRRILTAIVVAQWCVIGWLVKELLPLLAAGRLNAH